jgi:uncharacterized protein (TIGR03118 family)
MRLKVTLTSALAGCTMTACVYAAFVQTNLVSNVEGLAVTTDPNLRNPWGIARSDTSPFWVANQVTGKATIYSGTGAKGPFVVSIPGGNPTGQVFNGTSGFALSNGNAMFMFATLDGTIAGWNGNSGTTAETKVSNPEAVYTGLALANNGSGNFLYAANGPRGSIDIFNSAFGSASLSGSFTDPNLPEGFTPYNIRNLGGTLYVTYENEDEGGGVVNAFDANGNFLRRVAVNEEGKGPLESPWGLALAPAGFGPFGGALLVGNEDDGHISAFDPVAGTSLGQLLDGNGDPLANTGLWGLEFGNGTNGTSPKVLYFAAGINEEQDGLFGSIAAVSEPGTLWLLAVTGTMLPIVAKRRAAAVQGKED